MTKKEIKCKPLKKCDHPLKNRFAVGSYTNNGGMIYCATVCLKCGNILFMDSVQEGD